MTEKEIIEKFRNHIIFKGEETNIKSEFALIFVEECDINNLAILGIEGFKVINNVLEPHLNWK